MFKDLFKSKVAAGLELHLSLEGIEYYNLCIFRQQKESVKSELIKVKQGDIKDLKEQIPAETPITLSLTGKGIIHKKVSVTDQYNFQELLQKVLPNANLRDFYVQFSSITEIEGFVSVIRKDTLDKVLQELSETGKQVINLFLGPFIINAVTPFLELSEKQLLTSDFVLGINDGKIESIDAQSEEILHKYYRISEEMINAEALPAFAAGISYFTGLNSEITINIPTIEAQKTELEYQQKFKKSLLPALLFFLGVLLINYLVFDHYWSIKSTADSNLQNNQGLEEYDRLVNIAKEKENFLQNAGLNGNSKVSYYADRISKDLPPSIKLTQMEVFPFIKNLNSDTTISFLKETIYISGACKKSIELNDWIKLLKQKNWIKNLSLLNYTQEKENLFGDFKLKIELQQ